MKRTKVFVLGGTGFIGSALMKKFSQELDKYEVWALIHRNVNFRNLECFNTYTGDLQSFDLGLLDKFQPDHIIHMARMSGKGVKGRQKSAQKGAIANKRIIDHLKTMANKPTVHYVSGTLVYGDCGQKTVNEDSPINPTGFAKEYIEAEKPWMEILENGSLPVIMYRPPWIMGANSWFKNFFLNYMWKFKKVPMLGEGENWMTIIDVVDCAGLILHGLEHGKPGNYYNLAIPDYHLKHKDFAKTISELTGYPVDPLSREQIIQKFDETIYEAFTFSVKSISKHKGFFQSYNFEYPNIVPMIEKNTASVMNATKA